MMMMNKPLHQPLPPAQQGKVMPLGTCNQHRGELKLMTMLMMMLVGFRITEG